MSNGWELRRPPPDGRTTVQKGYGEGHRKLRQRPLKRVVDAGGAICPICDSR